MNTSVNHSTNIEYLEFDDKIHVHLSSNDILVIPYDYTKKISEADRKSLENYHLIGGGIGIHFTEIDEDISLNGIIHYKIEHELMAS